MHFWSIPFVAISCVVLMVSMVCVRAVPVASPALDATPAAAKPTNQFGSQFVLELTGDESPADVAELVRKVRQFEEINVDIFQGGGGGYNQGYGGYNQGYGGGYGGYNQGYGGYNQGYGQDTEIDVNIENYGK